MGQKLYGGLSQTDRTNLRSYGSLTRRASDRSATIGVGACGAPMAPAETLREDNQAAHTRESRQPVSRPPVD